MKERIWKVILACNSEVASSTPDHSISSYPSSRRCCFALIAQLEVVKNVNRTDIMMHWLVVK